MKFNIMTLRKMSYGLELGLGLILWDKTVWFRLNAGSLQTAIRSEVQQTQATAPDPVSHRRGSSSDLH
jgi:hypothetical protein